MQIHSQRCACPVTNALTYTHNLARVLNATDTVVDLAYEWRPDLWPWLSLPPSHPVLVEKYQYFATMTASWAMGTFSPKTYTALTMFEWQCTADALGSEYPTQARCENWTETSEMGFKLNVSNAQGKLLYTSRGQGFAFRDRDFQQWREKSRRSALQARHVLAVDPIDPGKAGLGDQGHSFVSNVIDRVGKPTLYACVPKHGGFYPQHPFHTGSGDHVNAAQLLDCALQATHVFAGDGKPWTDPLICIGGQAHFQRYVELDVPFEITLDEPVGDSAQLRLSQAGRDNVLLRLDFQPATS